ncbi:FIST signal transduction protein [Flavobacterium seoulense]|uniref:Histidine kinase n=1 Tax=Flavobacterium seoulense TaxID=1492738 RepID=A0A066X028_9FLAO|nr:FIST N-terminal domain-containing protein [Flavobacterium seoulense]KDN56260.1 histidine kinase [Flavobacterium seoulense]
MKIQQVLFVGATTVDPIIVTEGFENNQANLVLAFAERTTLEESSYYSIIKNQYPNAVVVICSTAGQISNTTLVEDKNVVVTALEFEKTNLKAIEVDILEDDIIVLGQKIKQNLFADDLKSILILSEGSFVNGTELINELIRQTNAQIPIFGGLAGDEFNFEKTIVGLNSEPKQGKIGAIGFYGNNIHFGFGSKGGWTDFGPEREVTSSDKNVLYKIGDKLALDLYKEYLGKYADELPGSSLYFPLSMKETADAKPVVRTILAIDEEKKSMTFAGNIPEGSFVRFMKGNLDKLIEASYDAASKIAIRESNNPQFALMVSCVGRKIVLGNRIEEEIEVVKDLLDKNTVIGGFYSYGEISPTLENVSCELHNQTMTITIISED